MPSFAPLKWLHVSSVWVYRVAAWAVIVAGLLFAGAILLLRYWLLPQVDSYRNDIAEHISAATRQRITIGKIEGNWDGLHPYLILSDLRVYDAEGRTALALERVDSTLSWWTLYLFDLRFAALDVYRPDLSMRRDRQGVIHVGGIAFVEAPDAGFPDWLLRQRRIAIHDATLHWQDERRGAPPLELKGVNFRLENSGRHHRFGLRAVPPQEVAAAVDLRGDLLGRSVGDLAEWNGRLFAQLDYVDIAAWQRWITFPFEMPSGSGALRLWLDLERGMLHELTADIELAGVRTRLAADREPLDLSELKGRVAWKAFDDGFEFAASKLALATPHGLRLPPADLILRMTGRGQAAADERGEFWADALELEPLVVLANHLPFDKSLHAALETYWPAGGIDDFVVKWRGAWPAPSAYSAKGRFVNLRLKPSGKFPGFTGVTGNVDGNEKGGTLYLNSHDATVELPRVFRDKLDFDTLTAQVAWARAGPEWELRLNNIAFANRHLAGTLYGSYRTERDTLGVIDFTGNLTRAEAKQAPRYIPLVVGGDARAWLDAAFLGGTSNDVRLRVQGNLTDFPFAEERGGTFQVTAKVDHGILDYAEHWPRIENLSAELAFRGNRVEISAREGTIFGAKLQRVHAEIPDLLAAHPQLKVGGEAAGPTGEFLRFVAESPVAGMIDNFTEGFEAQGSGHLQLKLDMPLADTRRTKIAGSYVLANNTLKVDPGFVPLEQVNGRLEFTDSAVRIANANFIFLGGPASVSGTTQKDGTVRMTFQGRANFDKIRGQATNPLLKAMRGAGDWRGTAMVRAHAANIVFESSLQGVALDLPAPLVKTAAEALPLRLERRVTAGQQDRLSVSLGTLLSAQVARRFDQRQYVIDRANVVVGGVAPPPDRRGIWVSGQANLLDLDRWLALLGDGAGASAVEVGGFDLKVAVVELFGRQFHDSALRLVQRQNAWQGSVNGREVVGDLIWRAQGRGQLTARLKQLSVPAALVAVPGSVTLPGEGYRPTELPALDITAENFSFRDKPLGKLELAAVPDGRDWRIDKLRLANPDATLAVEGLWQASLAPPRTQLNVQLDVNDIGKLLLRLGYPEGVRRGTAKIDGPLSWTGAPYDIDYPTLSGNIVLEAQKGQFAKLEPGAAKLLGVLSLQSLPRRLSLDFRDIFSEGLAFDDIVATVKINRGAAATEGLRIGGPSARILMSGEVDIAQETQNLRVKITPFVGDTLSVAGALVGGPVAGVATFLVQKILKDPLNEMAAYDYRITGTWVDPVVSKIAGGGSREGEKPK